MPPKLAKTLFFAFALLCAPVSAHNLEAIVIKILDGGCMKVIKRSRGHEKVLVCLAGISAPKKGQPFYDSARKQLSQTLLKKPVVIEWDKYDEKCAAKKPRSQCPIIGRVVRDGNDVNLLQVSRGLAWIDPERMDELSTPDRTTYNEAESKAQSKKRGLWKAKRPTPPWEWGKKKRSAISE